VAARYWLGIAVAAVTVAAVGASASLRIDHPADPAQLAAVVRLARGAQLIGIGEAHDHPTHHAVQIQVLEALVAAGARPALAFEMLTRDQQSTVDAAMTDALSVEELDHRLGWRARGWPDFTMYYPLFEIGRRYGLSILAADLDPASVRTVSRRGLGALAESDRLHLASRLSPDTLREQRLREQLQVAHCGLLSAPAQASMAEAWHARNVTIARRIIEVVDRGRSVVLITGRAHLASDGVPGQIDALRPGTRVFVIDLVEAGSGELPNADLVWTTTARARPDRCEELRTRRPPWRDPAD
jgi:uncharacterized iron-regulated protein